MDASQNYVDQYLRRKKGAAFGPTGVQAGVTSTANQALFAARAAKAAQPQAAPPQAQQLPQQLPQHIPQQQPYGVAMAAAPGTVPGYAMPSSAAPLDTAALDTVAELSGQVQNFVDRTDTLNLQVQTLEDKLLNLTKMMKLAQNLAEEREQDLRAELKEARHRDRETQQRLESVTAHFEAFRDVTVPELVQAAAEDVSAKTAALLERRDAMWEARLEQTRNDVVGDMQARMDALIAEAVEDEQRKRTAADAELKAALEGETAIAITNSERRAHDEAAAALSRKAEQLAVGIETAKREAMTHADHAAERASAAVAASSDARTREAVSALERAVERDMHVADERATRREETVDRRLEAAEAAHEEVAAACKELATGLQEHASVQEEKATEAAQSLRELMDLHEQTRNVVSQELEGTKQWATRNMQRIKKHLDNANGDIAAVREAQAQSQTQVQQLQAQQSDEHRRLQAVLAEKTREAQTLSDMVDKEITSMHHLTSQHKQQMQTDAKAREEEALDKYQDRARARREQLGTLFSDLKTRGRPHSQPPTARF